ncbi:CLUMA_CG017405, isoform C [Clunio marinus]|uniref:CLUMA_CG017405, isoform C n=1 Tax=Clunio marinus TaxID=568069 RepID=A0A1J1IXK7_9DIPT|nr:CLUMA_CG017405, isoform C [Clunio marinus]
MPLRTTSTTIAPATIDPNFEIIEQRRAECIEFLDAELLKKADITYEPGTYCDGQFDGWSCFPDTPSNTIAKVPCPPLFEFDPTRFAHKVCESDGNWFRHPETNKTWTNYTTCIDFGDYQLRRHVNLIYVTGYTISLIAILLSISIFCYFRSLKCARITLHMNLFASFAANNFLWLIWYHVILDTNILNGKDQWPCVMLHLILHYFLLTNYAWMLCEGFYLHTVLVSAFISEQKLVRWLIALGWSAPAVFLIFYGILRGYVSTDEDRTMCWMNESPYTNVLVAPVCLSMLLNLLFLCNIVRVVLLKLKAPASMSNGPGSGPSRNILQAFRATLLLVPLLGLQYILTPFRPGKDHPYEATYEIISAFTASFQGLCVATLFCFCNGEVMAQVKRRWRIVFFRPRANSYTATQVSSFIT